MADSKAPTAPSDEGERTETFALDRCRESAVHWPPDITVAEMEFVEDWLMLVLRKMHRRAKQNDGVD